MNAQQQAVPAGIYTTTSPENVRYIAHHCEAAVAGVENLHYLELFQALRAQLPQLRAVVVMQGGRTQDDVYAWDDFLRLGDGLPDDALEQRLQAQSAEDL